MKPLSLALMLVPLAACGRAATDGPSLLPRPIERLSLDEPAAAPPTPVAPDPALDAELARIRTATGAAEAAFDTADRRAAPLFAAGARAAIGSDAWLDAQSALTGLDDPRATLLDLVTSLDDLASARAAAGQPPYPAVATTRTAAEAALARVDSRLRARQATLPVQ